MTERKFALRYYVDNEWNKPPLIKPEERLGGNALVGASGEKEFGYADRLFIVSIAYTDGGEGDEISSIFLLDTREGPDPSREILEAVKASIEHHLEHHC